jgi:FkbM family methyltransferase
VTLYSRIKQVIKPFVLKNKHLSRLSGNEYFGLNNLDEKILDYINTRDGYFVELGANDGITQSNTKYFELYKGWHGVLIEPSPKQFSSLKKFRSRKNLFYNCACVGFDFPNTRIEIMYSNLMSIALEGRNDIQDPVAHAKEGENHSQREKAFTFHAQARTLQSILDEAQSPKIIDLLSLDVEGGELEVLGGIDFRRTNFRYIVIETRSIKEIGRFLEARNYKQIAKLTHHDFIFKLNQL